MHPIEHTVGLGHEVAEDKGLRSQADVLETGYI